MMMRRGRAALAAALTLALGACSEFRDRPPVRQGPIFSPNGEPLSGGPLGDPSCADAMGTWLARVDTDHDGTIDLKEFLADARRQFAAMDLEKSGVLTPAVLAQYRAPYSAERPGEVADDDQDQGQRRRGRRDDDTGDSDNKGPPRVLERADPVMLADVQLRNRVTLEEFLTYERGNFASLDRNRNGRLDRDELVATCQPSR
jgi:hypothetical protein